MLTITAQIRIDDQEIAGIETPILLHSPRDFILQSHLQSTGGGKIVLNNYCINNINIDETLLYSNQLRSVSEEINSWLNLVANIIEAKSEAS